MDSPGDSLFNYWSSRCGRQVRQGDAIQNDGRCTFQRESFHRTSDGEDITPTWSKRLETPLFSSGYSGFLLAEAESRPLRGRLFLAWVPSLSPGAQKQSSFLGCQGSGKQTARPEGLPELEEAGLVRHSRMGVPDSQGSHNPSNSQDAEFPGTPHIIILPSRRP